MTEEKLTACGDCKFLIVANKNPQWMDLYCKKATKPEEFDPLSGKFFSTRLPYFYIREMNKGFCRLFEKKGD